MRKTLLFLALTVFPGLELFAVPFSMSTGAGGLIGGYFTRYKSSSTTGSGRMSMDVNQLNYGGFVFFDATYAEFAVILQGGLNKYNEVVSDGSAFVARAGDGWETMLGLSLLGKYPFTMTNRTKIFPILGADYQISLVQKRRPDGDIVYDRTNGIQEEDKDGNAFDITTWNSIWIHLGAGADYLLAGRIFLRGEFLYSFRLMTAYERDGLAQAKVLLDDNDPKLRGLTSGPSLRLSAGYRL